MKIVLCRSKTIGSLLIRLVTWSDWSHVAVVDGDEVIEAVWPRVRVSTLDSLKKKHHAVVMVEFPVEREAEFIAVVRSQLGKPYDLLGVLGLGWHRNWQEEDAWWCSELPAWAAAKIGAPLFRAEAVHRIVPQHWWLLAPEVRNRE